MLPMNRFRKLLMALALVLPWAFSSCAVRAGVGYRVYDPYYRDYHVWGDPEVTYYNQWVVETHRPHTDYRRLRPEEQHQYWDWRHSRREGHEEHHAQAGADRRVDGGAVPANPNAERTAPEQR